MTRNHFSALVPIALLCAIPVLSQTAPSVTTVVPAQPAKAVRLTQARTGDVRFHTMSAGDPGMRADLRIAPPGMWWKNPDIVEKLSLSSDQQKRMDDIFQQSRLQLIDLKANVEKQEVMLEPMLSANPPDTNKVLAQIDHVAGARAELEKANARMLLGIRGVLSADQWTKLQAEQHNNQRFLFRFKGPGGPDGPGFGPGAGPKGPGPDGFRTHPGGMDNFKFAPEGPLSLLTLPPLTDSGPEIGSVIGGISIDDAPELDIHIEAPDDDIDL